jgi:hypothetical protein
MAQGDGDETNIRQAIEAYHEYPKLLASIQADYKNVHAEAVAEVQKSFPDLERPKPLAFRRKVEQKHRVRSFLMEPSASPEGRNQHQLAELQTELLEIPPRDIAIALRRLANPEQQQRIDELTAAFGHCWVAENQYGENPTLALAKIAEDYQHLFEEPIEEEQATRYPMPDARQFFRAEATPHELWDDLIKVLRDIGGLPAKKTNITTFSESTNNKADIIDMNIDRAALWIMFNFDYDYSPPAQAEIEA